MRGDMHCLYSNGTGKFVLDPFSNLICKAPNAYLAASFHTVDRSCRRSAGGNPSLASDWPERIDIPTRTTGHAGVLYRYLAHRFHAKVFIFGDTALIGSSNLTDGGLLQNRKAVIQLSGAGDAEAVESD